MAAAAQMPSLFASVRNLGLFSGHWLEHRLELEPEWREVRDRATDALDRLGELWKVQRARVELYGDEQGLEEGFIQHVWRELGWKLKYQTFLEGREPDYALFLDDTALDAALTAGRKSPDFWARAAVVADLRREMVRVGRFTGVEAFPQKDDPARRVFREAKLSTAVFGLRKGHDADAPFRARVHPGRDIEGASPGLSLTTADIPLYDPNNFTVVSCDQADWDLAIRILRSGRMSRLGAYAESFQGEVNETNDRAAGRISYHPRSGPEAIRGAHICMYAIREASQGKAVYIIEDKFLARPKRKEQDTKAFHHRWARVGFQRKSPQNNFRRLIAAMVQPGIFLLESVSYVPEHRSRVDLRFVLGLLNTKLADWYFRLGGTNAMISEYQVNNLPCPIFADTLSESEASLQKQAEAALTNGRTDEALRLLRPLLANPPFSPAVREAVVAAVRHITAIEAERGAIARRERSALDPAAQPYQDFIDRLFYGMAGLTDAEVRGLESRYATML